ncbi:MAG: winged helix-turn-helix domain-containing protein [Acidobacteriota bacterium]|nr:winged helix-turn-helix domain-containing protein [Acidobacteriota bacterium]
MSQDKNLKYEFDDFSFDVKTGILTHAGVPLSLTRKARQVLLILVRNANRTIEKDEIYNQIWTDSFVEEANLTQYIYLLRKSFSEQSGEENSYIETVPGQGYRFNAQVREVAAAEADENDAYENDAAEKLVAEISKTNGRLTSFRDHSERNIIAENPFVEPETMPEIDKFEPPSTGKPQIEIVDSPFTQNRKYLWRLGSIGAVLLIIAAISFYRFYNSAPSEIDKINSLAVLPFAVVGEEKADDKLGLGMADALITRLSKLQTITVRPTSAVFRYTDRPAENSAEAGRDLGVDSVLEGTVQMNEKNVRVSVRLIKVADGKTLWAEDFNEKFGDIFSVQDLISAQVVETLSLKLNGQPERLPTVQETANAEAFQSYQLGNYFWNLRGKDDLQKAVGYFQKAAQLDPNYARAYAALADSYALLGFYNFADQNEMSEKAWVNAEIALKLNPALAEPYVVLAVVEILRKNYPAAQTKIERAVALAPRSSSARHRYAVILLINGKLEESAAQMRLAQEYDPLSPTVNKSLCNVLIAQRNFAEAVAYCEKSVGISADTPGARASLAHAYFLNKRNDEAFAQINLEMQNDREQPSLLMYSAYFNAKTGRIAEAEKVYTELKERLAQEPLLAVDLTTIGYALGKKKESLEHYKKMLEVIDSEPESRIFFKYDQMWDAIKRDPDFDKIYQQAAASRQN